MVGIKVSEEKRREAILRAAYDVAARQGLEALTIRAVAARADVSHGTVLFHFKRKHELVSGLLDRVMYATAVLRIPDTIARITRPSERMHALLRAEMDRLSTDPRHFRLFLDYWTFGVRNAAIRQRVRAALEAYRSAFRDLAEVVMTAGGSSSSNGRIAPSTGTTPVTAEGVTAVAVSLIHGCALQAVIDPKGFDVRQHFDAAARMLDRLSGRRRRAPRAVSGR
jgi:TetR/AcrR family transcriptional repressor of bet genes